MAGKIKVQEIYYKNFISFLKSPEGSVYAKIVERLEGTMQDKLKLETCMKKILTELMRLSSNPNTLEIVKNGLMLSTALYRNWAETNEPSCFKSKQLTPLDKARYKVILKKSIMLN